MQTNHSQKKLKTTTFHEELDLSNPQEADMQDFLAMEEATFSCLKFFQDKEILQFPDDFSRELELQALEESSDLLPLPKYLQNYMDISFETKKHASEQNNSFVIKIANEGLKILTSLLDSSFHVLPSLETSVRSKEADITQTINLEEKNSSYQIHYQVIRENENEVYLSIHFPKNQKNPYDQVVLRKNGRFIYSSQIGERGIVSFSGLKEGRYLVEFLGKKSSKSIDITILLDHPREDD